MTATAISAVVSPCWDHHSADSLELLLIHLCTSARWAAPLPVEYEINPLKANDGQWQSGTAAARPGPSYESRSLRACYLDGPSTRLPGVLGDTLFFRW